MFSFDHFAEATKDLPKRIPPPPTPLSFPPCPEISSSGRSLPPPGQLEIAFRIKNVKLLNQEHLLFTNLHVENDCSAEALVPQTYLPPQTWRTKPGTSGAVDKPAGPSSNQMLSNGAAVPGHEAFYNRMVELTYPNEDGFGAILRRPPPAGQAPIRIAQFRRFWTELQHVGSFWDTSKDNLDYDDPQVQEALAFQQDMPSPVATKKINLDLGSSKPAESSVGAVSDPGTANKAADDASEMPSEVETADGSGLLKEASSPKVTYAGFRHSTGNVMPSKHRDDLLRTFIEPIAWSFGCVLERTMSQPHLHVGTTRLTADHSMRAFRGPQDRQRSRAKIVEGPLMALQCTHETDFAAVESSDVEYLVRELSALLVIAQERHREGKTEKLRGAGQWWAEKQRWGGGTGEAIGRPLLEDDGSESLIVDSTDKNEPKEGSAKLKRPSSSEAKQQMKKTLLARSHKPPGPIWEKRVDYMRIGKASDEEFDTVFLVASLNHHLALVRLSVHPRFLDLLDDPSGTQNTESTGAVPPWYGLWLTRSKWYDLLDPTGRVEAMCGLWSIMGWLMRDTSPSNNDQLQHADETMTE